MPSPRATSRVSPRVSQVVKATLATVLIVNLLAFAGLKLMFPWLSWWPAHEDAVAAPAPEAKPAAMRVPGRTTAQDVVDQVMRTTPKQFQKKPWAATVPGKGTPALPFDYSCGNEPAPTPGLSETKGWVDSTGPLPSDVRGAVQVTARAYSAGEASLAVRRIEQHASSCFSTDVVGAPRIGVQSTMLSGSAGSALVWRRGDVLMVATVRHTSVSALMPVWKQYDDALVQALRDHCANPDSPDGDWRRSPYADRARFTGLTKGFWVHKPDTQPKPVPPGAKPVRIPAPELNVPYVSRMAAPAPPISPPALPAEPAYPTRPRAPKKPPEQVRVGERIPDQTGPGCGWAFTNQTGPRFDQQRAEDQFQARRAAVSDQLDGRWQRWEQQRVDYFAAYARYVRQVRAYEDYAAEVRSVEAQWAPIVARRQEYVRALAAWRSAVAARASFLREQAAARQSYQQALARCASQPAPSPSPSPTPKQSPTPSPAPKPPGPGKGNGAGPVPGPKPAAYVVPDKPKKPSAPQRISCPPPRPSILDASPPSVPPQPAAPDASFPEWYNPGHLA